MALRTIFYAVALVASASLLSGCAIRDASPGVTYAEDVQQLGIYPVYPPREGLQVGDVYAVERHGDSNEDRLKARSAYVGSLNLTNQIRQYLATRYQFGSTVVTQDGQLKAGQSDAANKSILPQSTFANLPIAAFPDIEVDSGVSVAGGGQPNGLLAALGFSFTKTLKMELHFNDVTSYEVPQGEAGLIIENYCAEEDKMSSIDDRACLGQNLAKAINDKYMLPPGSHDAVKDASLIFVTKVYLAREIDYTYNDATLAAAAAGTVTTSGSAPDLITPTTIDKAVTGNDANTIAALAELQKAENDSVAKSGTTAGQGAISLAAINGRSVSFRQVFDRPVVIGYEGINRGYSE